MTGLYELLNRLQINTEHLLNLKDNPEIMPFIVNRFPTSTLLMVDILEPDAGKVYDIVIYDDKETELGGAEVSESGIYWNE